MLQRRERLHNHTVASGQIPRSTIAQGDILIYNLVCIYCYICSVKCTVNEPGVVDT